jgi:hypothetical protein
VGGIGYNRDQVVQGLAYVDVFGILLFLLGLELLR